MDLAGIAALITVTTALCIAVGRGLRWVYGQATRYCDDCCKERDELRAARDAALEAFRRREQEELATWRARPAPARAGEGEG